MDIRKKIGKKSMKLRVVILKIYTNQETFSYTNQEKGERETSINEIGEITTDITEIPQKGHK